MYNMQQEREGEWKRRPGTEYLHPDRKTQFQFTQPLINRSIADYGNSQFNNHDYLYNCHKRKTIALGKDDDTQFVFMGVIVDHNKTHDWQSLRIYRGEVSRESTGSAAFGDDPLDGVTVAWDRLPSFVAPVLGSGDNSLSDIADRKRETDCFIEYSMVMSADLQTLYIVIGMYNSTDNPHSVVRVVALTNLYNSEWNSLETYPTWTQVGADILNSNSGTAWITNDIDIEIDADGIINVVHGYFDSDGAPADEYYFKYYKYISGIWSNVSDINPGSDGNAYGVVMKLNPSDFRIYIGYLFVDETGDDPVRGVSRHWAHVVHVDGHQDRHEKGRHDHSGLWRIPLSLHSQDARVLPPTR